MRMQGREHERTRVGPFIQVVNMYVTRCRANIQPVSLKACQ
jgi:hypothetical protein